MKPQDENRKLREYIRQSKQRRRWHRLTAVLATAAAVLTFCVMVLPAITLENTSQTLVCHLDDLHTHTDSCYNEEGELVCGYADFVAHTHDSSCYGEDGTLICPLEERKPHTHMESCYQETEVLVCGQEETQGHTHSEACYETQLVCGQEEGQGHTHTGHIHTEECYTVGETLVCTNTEPDHVHTEECYETQRELTCTQDTGCYDANGNLVCGLEETQGHTHTQACYETQLVCGQEESQAHTHTDSCYEVRQEVVCGQEEVILHTHTEECRDEEGNLTCGMVEIKEHVHDETCLPETTSEPEDISQPEDSSSEESQTEEGQETVSQSGTSWATVSKPGYEPAEENGVALFSANALLAASRAEEGYDFAGNITSVTVAKEQNGQWVPGTAFTVGDKVQVVIAYSIPADIVTEENKVIYYQLPQGIGLTEDEMGDVTIGDQVVGTYTITTSGLITITFQDNFADGRAFEGSIQFQGTVDASGEGEEDTIIFGGEGGTITVEPDAGDTDLSITKSGTYDSANEKIHYTVTVSSEQGSDGPITVNDKFLSGGATCDNNIGITGPDGLVENAEITYQNAKPHFTISELPALEAGESYTITYTATVNLENTGTEDGSLTVSNRVEAKDQTNTVYAISDVLVSEARIRKTGVYNPSTREVVWTVYIYNPHGYNLAGKTLSDTMTWTYGEKTLTQNIESATLTPYTGEKPGDSVTIKLPYEFPENSTQSYILTYTTSLPKGADEGANLSVTNTAWLGNWKAVYTIDGTVPGETGLVKAFTGQGDGDAVESDLNWSSIITFPQNTLANENLDTISYVDIIQDAVNEGWQLQAAKHYTTRGLLQQMVVAPVEGYTQLDALTYGTDYTIQVVTAEDFRATLGEAYYTADGVGYVFKIVTFVQLFEGFSYEGETFKFTWSDLDEVGTDTPIAMFAVTFTQSALDELNAAGQISISYSTHYDLSKVTGNGTYTLANGGRTPSNSAAAQTETALLAQLNKQVSTIGGHDYTLESEAYTDGPAEIDVGDTDGNIYYRILLYNFGDEISLQDTMWATQNGGNISVDSIRVYDPSTGEPCATLKVWGDDGHFGKVNDNYGIYNLKNLGAYRGYIIGLYYHVDVSAQVAEGETEIITNTVEWIGVDDDSATAQVTNSGATLEKTGEALEDGLVRYYVTINPSGRDLLENGSTLTLTDTLTLSANSAAATFLPETAKLYRYDAAEENNLGEDISERLSLTYEEETHTITFTLPDQVACVVVYEYEITRGTAAGNIDVSNTAQLTGVATTGSGSELVLTDQSSGATVNSATLRIYKHEAGSINALLPQAHFTLERYEQNAGGAYEWTPSTLTALGEDGSFIVEETGYIELNFLAHAGTGSLYNTLYRLQETQAPEGYAAEEGYRYFVWMEQGKDEAGTYAAMQEADAWPEGIEEGEVTFIAYSTNGAIYVPNEPLTTSITVEKQWQGAEGTELEEGEHPDEVKVTLYQQTAEGEPVQYGDPVMLTADKNWGYTWEQLPKEVDGQAVTYTVVETPVAGWDASYTYPEDGDETVGVLEGTVQITNTKQSTFTLPETGGVGPTLVAIAGVPLIGAAGVAYRNLRRKRRRGGEAPISRPPANSPNCIATEYQNRKEKTTMKKARKLTAVLLSLVMLLVLAIPAAAEGPYSITITNTDPSHTYTAYQIFSGDVAENDAEVSSGFSQLILSNIEWGSNVSTSGLISALKNETAFTSLADEATAADVAKLLIDAEALDAFLNVINAIPGFLAGAGTTATPGTGANSCTINLDEAGYYLIKDSLADGTVGESVSDYIVQVLGQESVQPKESPISTVEKKVQEDDKYTADDGYGAGYNDVADWDIGDKVPFKLIGSIPDMSAYNTYNYVFHDTLSAGLTLEEGSVKVYVANTKNANLEGQTPLTSSTYSLVTTGLNNGESFTITFDNLKTVTGAEEGKFIIVTYTATLNANAEIGLPGNPNEVYLEFSNDPNGDGTGKTTTDKVIVFTYELDGTKVDGEDITTTLPGAQFVLLNADGDKVAKVGNDGKFNGWENVPTGTGEGGAITYNDWATFDESNKVILTSDDDGFFKVIGLDDGTYKLREIQAPNGYNLLDHDLRIDIAATTTNGQDWNGVTDALTALTIAVDGGEAEGGNPGTGAVNVQVENNQGATLPETGGMGTTLFYIIGGLLVVGAGILLVVRIRMKAHNE